MVKKLVTSKELGLAFAKETLYKSVTPETLLLLSGGNTPKPLYEQLAIENKLQAGAIALVDERYGEEWHENSNEKMIKETGLWPFERVLESKNRKEDTESKRDAGLASTVKDYELKIQKLFKKFGKKVAVVGIGADGHTAGLPAGIMNYESRIMNQGLVDYIPDFSGEFKERITLTFKALEQIDQFIILVFGEDKKKALQKMFTPGSEQEIPARFYTRSEIAEKTLLITDQTL